MASIRIMQISDTHLSPRTRRFHENNELMIDVLKAADHALIVHTGDITLDGIRFEEDYAFCREFLQRAGKDIRYIPGNHDVGDNPRLSQPETVMGSAISQTRLERYERYYGADRWSIDAGNWRLLGINSLRVGSGLDGEQQQYDWIREQLKTLGDRYLVLFSHQPLFVDSPESTELTYWTVDPIGRENLRELMEHPRLKMIASGHLHQQRSRSHGGVQLEWCSSIAFTTREELVPEMGGNREVGYLDHVLHDDGRIETRPVTIAGFVNSYLDDCLLEVYPKY
ncbi:metallophosphoesterase family protein [Mesorhizobium sp. ES1-1]|uniref:metallophosphoesterase family protein n=1 Tax=Mesorhizobium sp. ES1-1 TaxID=2876629 RepID=UPI001CCA07CD|nr:metallophosphoesterase [Mesorhizobium sp. ES1-1]MBZ9678876.1 metallophosphoesterase [Mesorhizobium sp. ES1-1]